MGKFPIYSLRDSTYADCMDGFAVYLYPETCMTSRPRDEIEFVGQSLPHFDAVRCELRERLNAFPSLPLREADLADFARVHDAEYLNKLERMADGEALTDPPRRSLECLGLEYALPGYRYSLGGICEAIDQVRSGTLRSAYCFALPGHHAYADWGHGYCLLNPVAAAARYAQRSGFDRVLIVDWDHHHGDGTQAIFAGDDTVHCISVHSAIDLYMSIMRVHASGTTCAGKTAGHRNIPVLDRTYSPGFLEEVGFEGEYVFGRDAIEAFRSALLEVPWRPDLILVFAGYDGHQADCGNRIQEWDEDDFTRLTRLLCDYAALDLPVVSVHGGGYKLNVTVCAALAHINTLAVYPGCDSNA